MNISILVADSLHINKRNFASFFSFVEREKIRIHFENSHHDWLALYGVYDSKLKAIGHYIQFLSRLSSDDLYQFTIDEVNLFHISRGEIMSLVAKEPEWYGELFPTDKRVLFNKLFKCNKMILLNNLAAAWYWVDFWKRRLTDLGLFSHCCVFSGSLIYQRALIEQLKYTPTRVMVMESLFTGNEYYYEERYSPIANHCDIKHSAVYKAYLQNLETGAAYDKERMKAINKIILSKNKNVQQPDGSEKLKFSSTQSKEKSQTVAIIGQVVNDSSILEYKNIGLSSIHFYKELLVQLAHAGFNVVLKTHPWEEKKNNIKKPLTKHILTDYVATLPENLQNKIQIIDHYAIKQLFAQSQYIVGLNSQGLLEAAFEGFKPIQFGDAFYGNKGFTYDYSIEEISQFIDDIKNNKLQSSMTLDEFDAFECFMTILLQKHTVSVHNSGVPTLRRIFELPATIPLSKPAASKCTEEVKNSGKNKESEKKIDKETVEMDAVRSEAVQIVKASNMQEMVTSTGIPIIYNGKQNNRKLQKFKRNPRAFFADSKFIFLRPLRNLFKLNK